MGKTILASAVADRAHIAAFDQVAASRASLLLAEMVYMLDITQPAVLPVLAEQFDVLGFKGWALTTTEAERRALLKQAIELHRYKGTPWAVKEAIKRVGFAEVTIIEGGRLMHDGTILRRNAEYRYGSGTNWAIFRIFIELGNRAIPTQAEVMLVIAMVNEYKNVRSLLTQLQFTKAGVQVAIYNGEGQPL